MVVFRNLIRCKLALADKIIEQATKFKYLGVDVTYNRNTQNETHTSNEDGNDIIGLLT